MTVIVFGLAGIAFPCSQQVPLMVKPVNEIVGTAVIGLATSDGIVTEPVLLTGTPLLQLAAFVHTKSPPPPVQEVACEKPLIVARNNKAANRTILPVNSPLTQAN